MVVGFTKCVAFFSLFFDSILDFSVVCGGVREKVNSPFDRARQVLSWSPLWENPSGKYANPDAGYPPPILEAPSGRSNMKDVLEAHGLVLSPKFRIFFKINQFSSEHMYPIRKINN